MGFSDILNTIKDKPKSLDNKLSKDIFSTNKNLSKSIKQLISVQEKSPVQKNQLRIQNTTNQRIQFTNEKLTTMSKITTLQTRILEHSQKILTENNKYLESIEKGLRIDRQERRISEDEAKRNYRRNKINSQSFKANVKSDPKKSGGLFDTLANFLGLGSGMDLLISSILGSKVVKGLKAVGGFFKTITSSFRGFLFGSKIVDEAGMLITRTEGIFSKIGKTGKTIFSFLSSSTSILSRLGKSALNFVNEIPIVTKLLSTLKSTSLAQKGLSIGKSVIGVGSKIAGVAKPLLGMAGSIGKGALSLGGKALSGIGNFLAPTIQAGTKLTGGLFSKLIPGLGALLSFSTAISDFQKGDYIGVAINGLAGIASFIPGLGTLASGILTVVDLIRKGELTGIFTTISTTFTNMANYLSGGLFDTAKNYLSSTISGMAEMLDPTRFVDGIKNFISKLPFGSFLLGTDKAPPTTNSQTTTDTSSSGGSTWYNPMTWGGGESSSPSGSSPSTIQGTPVNNSTLAQKTFTAMYMNESSDSTAYKASHAVRGQSNFSMGRSQFDIGQRPDAWKAVGFSDSEIKKLQDMGARVRNSNGSMSVLSQDEKSFLGSVNSRLSNNKALIQQQDMLQQVNLSNNAKKMVTLLGQQGFTFSSPSVIAQFADIYNQFGSMDKSRVPELLQKFAGGKLITPDAILKYRLFRENNADQKRRHANIESQFKGEGNKNLTSDNLLSQFNSTPKTPINSPNLSTNQGTPQSSPASTKPTGVNLPVNAKTPSMEAITPQGITPAPPPTPYTPSTKAQNQANKLASNAPVIESYMQGSGKCYTGVWSTIKKSGVDLKVGGRDSESAADFARYALTTEDGKKKLDQVVPTLGKNGQLQGVQPGDIIVYARGANGHSLKHGHIEILGADGSAYSDYKNNNATDFKSAIAKGLVSAGRVRVFRLKGASGAGVIPEGVNPFNQQEGTQESAGANMAGAMPTPSASMDIKAVKVGGFDTTKRGVINIPESMQNMDYGKDNSDIVNKSLTSAGLGAYSLPKENTIMDSVKAINNNAKGMTSDEDLTLKKATGNLAQGTKKHIESNDKRMTQIRESLIKILKFSYPNITNEQAHRLLDAIKFRIPAKTDGILLKYLSKYDSETIKSLVKGLGLDFILQDKTKTPDGKPVVESKPQSMNTVTETKDTPKLDANGNPIVSNGKTKLENLLSSTSKTLSETGLNTYLDKGRQLANNLNSRPAQELLNNPMVNKVQGVLTALGVNNNTLSGSQVVDFTNKAVGNVEGYLKNPENIAKDVGNLNIGDLSQKASGIASVFGMNTNLGTLATNALSSATGFNTSGLLNMVGINPEQVANNLTTGNTNSISSIPSTLSSGVSNLVNATTSLFSSEPSNMSTRSLDLTSDMAKQEQARQNQINNSLLSIDKASNSTSTGVSQMTSNKSVREKPSLLNYADIGTAQIQSNVWG